MKKRVVISIVLVSSSILYLISRDPSAATLPADYPETITIKIPIHQWMDPVQSPQLGKENQKEFNEVRVVCIPRSVALAGAAKAMKDIGAHKTFQRPGGQGYCYAKFFYNPAKAPQARMICGGRIRQVEYDHAFSTVNQIPCWVTYLDNSENIKDKVENPLNYAQYVQTISQAINYLQTGLTAVSQ